MARMARSSLRASLRSGIRNRRTAGDSKVSPTVSGKAMLREIAGVAVPETDPVGPQARPKRIKAGRALLRPHRRRSGFGKALRTELRRRLRASARQARLRATSRRRG